MITHCHAGGEQHGPAGDCGPFGVPCASCWSRVLAIVERFIGVPSRWRAPRIVTLDRRKPDD